MSVQALLDNRWVKILRQTVSDWMQDGALRLSAALAYYSVFSIAPLLVIAISIAGRVLGPEAVSGHLDDQLKSYVGAQAAEAMQSMIKSASKPSDSLIGGIVGFFTLMLGASGIFGQLKDALNTIWEVKPKAGGGVAGFLRARFLNFGMVLVIGFLLLTSLVLSIALAAMTDVVGNALLIPKVIWTVVGTLVSFGVVTVLFAFIFKVLPDAKVQWRNVWIGSVITALLFEAGKFGLGLYLGRESTASAYGAAGSVVLLLLWVYYASCILLFGAEFTQVYARATGHVIEPAANAEPVTAEARAQQGLAPEKKLEPPVAVPRPAAPHSEPDQSPGPVGILLAVTATSFLLARFVSPRPVAPQPFFKKVRKAFAAW